MRRKRRQRQRLNFAAGLVAAAAAAAGLSVPFAGPAAHAAPPPPPPSTQPTQPAPKWYLAPEYLEDPNHAPMIARVSARAAKLDEAGIDQLLKSVTAEVDRPPDDDYWTLVVLEGRAEPAMVRALSDPYFQVLASPYPQEPQFKTADRLDALWKFLAPLASVEAIPPLAKLLEHPEEPVRLVAAMALGSIGKPECADPLRRVLRSGDHDERSAALMGLARVIDERRASPELLKAVFDDVASVVDRESVGGTQAPHVLMRMDHDRAVAFLLAPERFRADHREIGSIVWALADAAVVVNPPDPLVKLLDDLEKRGESAGTAYGRGLKLLALAGHPSAAARIEQAMTTQPAAAVAGPKTDGKTNGAGNGSPKYDRGDAADAYLALNGIPDAYGVAIDAWGGPGDLARLPEPIRNYATVQVLRNEVGNGGFGQYFFNSYAKDVNGAVAGLEAVGDAGRAKIVRDAVAAFGKDGPALDREVRQRQLEAIPMKALDDLSDAFLKGEGDLDVLLARYAVKHREFFGYKPPATQPQSQPATVPAK